MKAKMFKWCDWITETDPIKLESEYCDKLLASGFNIVGECDYHFHPQGYTKLFLLAESHFAIHTFPEESKTYIELTSCNEEKCREFLRLQGVEERYDEL